MFVLLFASGSISFTLFVLSETFNVFFLLMAFTRFNFRFYLKSLMDVEALEHYATRQREL